MVGGEEGSAHGIGVVVAQLLPVHSGRFMKGFSIFLRITPGRKGHSVDWKGGWGYMDRDLREAFNMGGKEGICT